MFDTRQQAVDFTRKTDAQSVGFNLQRLADVVNIFHDQITRQNMHSAAQLVVLRHGQVVLDCVGGTARGKPVTPDTPFYTFSVSKAFTAVCIHHLAEQGKINLDDRVADYWHDYGCKGKAETTIRQVLLHQAGIPAPHLYQQVLLWHSWRLVTRHVAKTRAVYPPGTKTAYHLVNYGFILGEVVRRVSGLSIDHYLAAHFLQPLGLKSTWLRIPATELKRSAPLETNTKAFRLTVNILNTPLYRRALLPAASLNATARDLAVFYQMLLNGGMYDNQQLLQPETISNAIQVRTEGMDEFRKVPIRWAMGFHLGGRLQTPAGLVDMGMGKGSSNHAFGHYGMASSLAFADPEAALVVAFTCNRLIAESSQRINTLLDALWGALDQRAL